VKCPVCHDLAIVVEHNRIELDYCVHCRGVWFDAGELELLMASLHLENNTLSIAYLLDLPPAQTKEHKRNCPLCQKAMKKVVIGEKPQVMIDVCPQGHGLWFDGGELDCLIKQLPEKPGARDGAPNEVITFLGDTFKAR
jgi:Zn-finger nucleic acid-binding protein